jgi:hypothetical protein
MPRSYTEPPVFLGDPLNQNLLHRAHRLQILSQAGQQTSEVSLVLAVDQRESLGK